MISNSFSEKRKDRKISREMRASSHKGLLCI